MPWQGYHFEMSVVTWKLLLKLRAATLVVVTFQLGNVLIELKGRCKLCIIKLHAYIDDQQQEIFCGICRSKYLFHSQTETPCLQQCDNNIKANESFDCGNQLSWMSHLKQTTKHQENSHLNIVSNTWDHGQLEKEKSLFIGQIPKDLQNVESSIQILMRNFLYSFDFVPLNLGHVGKVKVCNGCSCNYACIGFATDRVAQIVLAASQSTNFIWRVDGCYLSLQGCQGTETLQLCQAGSTFGKVASEQLKPAKIVFVGNIPNSVHTVEALRGFVYKVLEPVQVSVYLLRESYDAYLEMESEVIADALIYRCSKYPRLLHELSKDTFICRHPEVIPLMYMPELNTRMLSPQKSLWIAWNHLNQSPIQAIREVLERILLKLSSKALHGGYIKNLSSIPDKGFAHVELNSEVVADAIMEEYVRNTSIFNCEGVLYMIFRHAHYVRPGAKYKKMVPQSVKLSGQVAMITKENLFQHIDSSAISHNNSSQQVNNMNNHIEGNVGLHAVTMEHWNLGGCQLESADGGRESCNWTAIQSEDASLVEKHQKNSERECYVVVQGLTKGLSKEILHGALNEVFERALASYGVLQYGVYIIRCLTTYNGHSIVKLCNQETANVLLSLSESLKLSGQKLTLQWPAIIFSDWVGMEDQFPGNAAQ